MGQAPTRHVIMVYLHLNTLVEKYKAAAAKHYAGVLKLLAPGHGADKS